MSNNVMKIWNKDEEDKLIEEINILKNISLIANEHKRTVGGIRARIKKLIDNKKENDKFINLPEIIKNYFSTDNEKEEFFKNLLIKIKNNIYTNKSVEDIALENNITDVQTKKILLNLFNKENDSTLKERITYLLNKNNFDEEELIINILNYNSLEEIINKYQHTKMSKITNILKKNLKNDDLSLIKKQRINYLLKKNDECTNDDETNKVDNYTIINAIHECKEDIKDLKGELVDLRNRINLVLEKIDSNNIFKKNKSKNIIKEL